MSAADDAKRATELALIAMTTAEAYGTMFAALIGTLRDNKKITPSEIKVVFLAAAANVDASPAETVFQQDVSRRMRDLIVRVAASFRVDIPPPGQTGIQRIQ